ncbi:hypothetical protein, partial [Streptococcus pneumoniae]|uniref:hypothetical protein n=1 Tax=Streptococcus pneumoniae TaxID=1313 RepID=UPI0018B088B1
DSLDEGKVLTKEEFAKNLKVPGAAPLPVEETEEAPAGDAWGDAGAAATTPAPVEEEVFAGYDFNPRDLYQIEINEDVL